MSNKTSQLQKKNKNVFCTFPYKLWQLLDECTLNADGAIRWSDTGKSIIMDKTLFHTSIFVQRIFKSIQWKSFVRQLNMYGFHKSLPIHQHSQEEPCPCNCHVVTSIYYTHEHFRRWNFNDLTLVTRPKKSKSGFLNTVTENTKDVNGNASQPKTLAIEVKNEPQELVNWSEATVPVDMLPGPEPNLDLLEDVNGNASQPKPLAIEVKNEPQELVNWSEATVPVDMLPKPEPNLDLLEQNSVDKKNSFSMDIDVDIDRSMEMHPFFHVVPSADDAESWTGMTESSNMYCQLRNVSQPIPTSAIAVPFLYFSQSGDTEDLENEITVTLEVDVSFDDGDESMEVDMHQFEFNVEWCDDVGDRNDTENY